MKKMIKIPIKISARHIHLTQEDFKTLFGKEKPTVLRKIGQNQFVAKETVEIRNQNRIIKNLRVVAPFREETQVELSLTDAINLRIKPIIKISGNLKNTPGVEVRGSKGKLKLKQGVIVPQRHLHLTPEGAKRLGLKHKDIVAVLIKGKRKTIFDNVVVRVSPSYNLCCVHLDTDEGNAAGIPKEGMGYLVK